MGDEAVLPLHTSKGSSDLPFPGGLGALERGDPGYGRIAAPALELSFKDRVEHFAEISTYAGHIRSSLEEHLDYLLLASLHQIHVGGTLFKENAAFLPSFWVYRR